MHVTLIGLCSCGVAFDHSCAESGQLQAAGACLVLASGSVSSPWLLHVDKPKQSILAAAVRTLAWRSSPQAYTPLWNSMLADGVTTRLIPCGYFVCVGGGVIIGQVRDTQHQAVAGPQLSPASRRSGCSGGTCKKCWVTSYQLWPW